MDAMLRHKLDVVISAVIAIAIVLVFPHAEKMASAGGVGQPHLPLTIGTSHGGDQSPAQTPASGSHKHATSSKSSKGGSSGDMPPPPPPPPPLNSVGGSGSGGSGGSGSGSGSSSSGGSGSGGSGGQGGSGSGGSGSGGSGGGSSGGGYQMMVNFYSYFDSSPPSNQIDYPKVHKTAGGSGTYQDPITFASDETEFPPGTIVYIPFVKRYFIMEDSCDECTQDWTGKGADGGPKFRRLDGWIGGSAGASQTSITTCEDDLAQDATEVDPNPASNLPVSTQPLWNSKTNACYSG